MSLRVARGFAPSAKSSASAEGSIAAIVIRNLIQVSKLEDIQRIH